MTATDALTFDFCDHCQCESNRVRNKERYVTIWMSHNSTAGRIDKLKSVTISIAEKKRLTSVFNFRLQVPVDSPQSVLIGRPVAICDVEWHEWHLILTDVRDSDAEHKSSNDCHANQCIQ